MDIHSLGKTLIYIGLLIVLLGLLFYVLGRMPSFSFRFPGDIIIKGENHVFYFPLGICILMSILLTIIFRIIK